MFGKMVKKKLKDAKDDLNSEKNIELIEEAEKLIDDGNPTEAMAKLEKLDKSREKER